MKYKKRQVAFTFVEVLLAMALTLLVSGILFLFQNTGLSATKRSTSKLLMTSEIRNKMERISIDLRSTKEILEVRPSYLRVMAYKHTSQAYHIGDSALVTIAYELKRIGNQDVLMRTLENGTPEKLISLEHIDPEIFTPYYEKSYDSSLASWTYELFNMSENDSRLRALISFIKLKLSLRHINETFEVTSSVYLRPASSRIRQPSWKFR